MGISKNAFQGSESLSLDGSAVAEGNNSLTGSRNKILIKWIDITTSSNDWDLVLYSKDDYTSDPLQIANSKRGNQRIYIDRPYELQYLSRLW